MKIKNYLLLIIFFFTLCAMKCKKDDDGLDPNGLPKATQTGAMVFACKVNGENWIAKNDSYHLSALVKNNELNIKGALNTRFEDFYIKIFETPINQDIKYILNDPDKAHAFYITNQNCFDQTSGYGVGSAKSSNGELLITKFDQTNKIISGTFWFDIPTDKCGVLRITEGRFDIRYN